MQLAYKKSVLQVFVLAGDIIAYAALQAAQWIAVNCAAGKRAKRGGRRHEMRRTVKSCAEVEAAPGTSDALRG